MEERLGRTDRAIEVVCDLLDRQVKVEAQHQSLALASRQFGNDRPYFFDLWIEDVGRCRGTVPTFDL
jgi:hypothetical protein